MKTVVFLGSHSGGGASTAIKLLREMGIPCVSTSEILYEFIEELYGVVGGPQLALAQEKEGRIFRTKIAEGPIKLTFGSTVFPMAAVNKIATHLFAYDLVVMDCFNLDEFVFTRNWLGPEANYKILNIRSPKEQPGIDGQQLLQPIGYEVVHTIQNPMTEAGLKSELTQALGLNRVPQKQ